MSVAVLGAGIQGCCVAIELASAGFEVDLYDKSPMPMSHASRWNEGKLHLGYVYANDRTLKTARAMIQGSFAFSEFFRHYFGHDLPEDKQSSDFIYGIHRDSLLNIEAIQAHFNAIDEIIDLTVKSTETKYLGRSKIEKIEKLRTEDYFNTEKVTAAFRSSERSIDTHYIASLLAEVVFSHPLINFIGNTCISSVERCSRRSFDLMFQDGTSHRGYRNVVNSTWEDRLRIDQTMGYKSEHSWIYRYKLAIHFDQVEMIEEIPSSTFLLGPYGDVVNFKNGKYYLSWYPNCCIYFSSEHLHQESDLDLDCKRLELIAEQSYQQLRDLIPSLANLEFSLPNLEIKGGFICAIGIDDIHLMSSALHRRDQGGVFSDDGYHSIFTGK